jgi:EAL domain-containing protein (putative c-di-GMP-specific phosphodiesterase class I)
MNCPEAQGFWFSRPLHHDAVNDFLQSDANSVMHGKAQ